MSIPKIELCVASAEAARMVADFPIDRIETCASLENGGLTPSVGFVQWIMSTFGIEQHVLIRTRPAGFQYNYDELIVMRDDILSFKQLGVKGVVVGALKKDFTLDLDALSVFMRSAQGMDLTFHRAFDEVADWKTAMDELIKLRFKRILTCGQSHAVNEDSIKTLSEMIEYANGRIEIQVGGGVNENNAVQLKDLGLNGIHFSGTILKKVDDGSKFTQELLVVDANKIKRITQAIKE